MSNQSTLSAETYYQRGNVYAHQNDFQQALANFDKAIELNPQFVDAYYNRGLVYENLGSAILLSGRDYFEKALPDYSKAIELNPQFAKAYNNRGTTYYNLGLIDYALPNVSNGKKYFEKALLDYTHAIRLRTEDPKVYFNRSLIWLKWRDWKKAKADLSRARYNGFNLVEAVFISCGNNERDVTVACADFPPCITEMLTEQ